MKTLQKVKGDQIQAVLIVPEWPSALWWPILQDMLLEPLMRLPHYKEVIFMVDSNLGTTADDAELQEGGV